MSWIFSFLPAVLKFWSKHYQAIVQCNKKANISVQSTRKEMINVAIRAQKTSFITVCVKFQVKELNVSRRGN